ncbi:MAG: hypothetical protein QX203_05190, partial [Methylococcaceae bacterium]
SRDKLGRITQKIETVGSIANTFGYAYDVTGHLVEVKQNTVPTLRRRVKMRPVETRLIASAIQFDPKSRKSERLKTRSTASLRWVRRSILLIRRFFDLSVFIIMICVPLISDAENQKPHKLIHAFSPFSIYRLAQAIEGGSSLSAGIFT